MNNKEGVKFMKKNQNKKRKFNTYYNNDKAKFDDLYLQLTKANARRAVGKGRLPGEIWRMWLRPIGLMVSEVMIHVTFAI